VLPYLGAPIVNLFNQGIEVSRSLPRASNPQPGTAGAQPAARPVVPAPG
jgi:flagellar biosynthetic protein FliR